MISIFLILLSSTLVSFIGSLQLGPVNLFVINTVLFDSKTKAYYIALGGILPEFVYCSLAVFANQFFLNSPVFSFWIKIIFSVVLIVIGFFLLFKKTGSQTITAIKNEEHIVNKGQLVLKGFSLAILNPQLLPFWIFIQVYFNSISFLTISTAAHQMAFVIGSGAGAFILLAFFIMVVQNWKTKILQFINNKYYFKLLAGLFFIVALQQILTIINVCGK
jgi:threonine/homoserine/homoserine lactone efflux protein